MAARPSTGESDERRRDAEIQARWARLLLTSFADSGVRHVVVSPGSRSTPFVLAATDENRLVVHDVIDERAAAFFALGQARECGQPSLLLCTSGTAAAHYLPAVIEASMASVPLVILSADRPVELVDCGANQTIDQLKLFGDHVRGFVDLGLADARPGALRGARRAVAQAVLTATWPKAGAVHLNARARKPLEPQIPLEAAHPKSHDPSHALAQRFLDVAERPLPRPRRPRLEPSPKDLEDLATTFESHERGLLVAGPGPGSQDSLAVGMLELTQLTGWPLLADAASQLRTPEIATAGYSTPVADLTTATDLWRVMKPDVIVQWGRAPTATGWVARLADEANRSDLHWILGAQGWQDPESTASDLLIADPAAILEALLERLRRSTSLPRAEGSWLESWRRLSGEAEALVQKQLHTSAGSKDLSEAVVAATAVKAIPQGGLLTLGNSLTIRNVDLYSGAPAHGVRVLSQRGASGIDGLVAGAAGAAVTSGRPSLLLLGDVSLLHDIGSLATVPYGSAAFVVLVVDNQGGRIFEQLPVAQNVSPQTLDHWLTPPTRGRDFAHAAAFGAFQHRRVRTQEELATALECCFAEGGGWLIEARVAPSSARDGKKNLLESWGQIVAQSLET